MIPSISVQTLASVPSAAGADDIAEDIPDIADDIADDIPDEADDMVEEVEPPHAVKGSAAAAVAHTASPAFERATTVISFLRGPTG